MDWTESKKTPENLWREFPLKDGSKVTVTVSPSRFDKSFGWQAYGKKGRRRYNRWGFESQEAACNDADKFF